MCKGPGAGASSTGASDRRRDKDAGEERTGVCDEGEPPPGRTGPAPETSQRFRVGRLIERLPGSVGATVTPEGSWGASGCRHRKL